MEEEIVISLGGSIIIPEELDIEFLKNFKNLILSQIQKGKKFVIITGGGKINKKYNDAAAKLNEKASNVDLDWIGIAALKLNAELVRVVFGDYAHSKVIDNFTQDFSSDKPIVVGSAYEPGKSSDWDAVEAAKVMGAKKIMNLSNTEYVYDSDPRTNPNAKKIEQVSWADYRNIIPKEWTSRMNTPFDPIASEVAEKEGIQVMILNGRNIENLEKCLNGEKFIGSIIS